MSVIVIFAAFETTSIKQNSYAGQQDMPSRDTILTPKQGNINAPHIFHIQLSNHQMNDSLIIEEANSIFDSIAATSVDLDYTIAPDTAHFKFFSDNLLFFLTHSKPSESGIYDYRLPTSGYFHVKTFRFVVDVTNQQLKFVIARSTFL